jgi:hypothetical protein
MRRWIIGCAAVAIAGVLGCGVCGGLFFASIFAVLKSSTPYQMALAEVQRNPQVTANLGEPIEAGWLATGNIETTNSNGRADLDFTVTGPKGSADVHVLAEETAGKWKLTKLMLTYASGESQDVIPPAK